MEQDEHFFLHAKATLLTRVKFLYNAYLKISLEDKISHTRSRSRVLGWIMPQQSARVLDRRESLVTLITLSRLFIAKVRDARVYRRIRDKKRRYASAADTRAGLRVSAARYATAQFWKISYRPLDCCKKNSVHVRVSRCRQLARYDNINVIERYKSVSVVRRDDRHSCKSFSKLHLVSA